MSPEGSGCHELRVLQVRLLKSELGTEPVQVGTVPLKSALARIWVEKMASPFLLGMENIFPEHSFSAWNPGYRLKPCLLFPGCLSTLVYG